jgi:AhpD family alkylhydroperoxidase
MLLHLIKLRASVLNGCSFCVDMHSREGIADGEDTRRLFAVAAWREAPWFTDRERAALALTDEVTRLGDGGVSDEVWDAARRRPARATWPA